VSSLRLKDLNVKQVILFKYLACKFIMENFEDDDFLDDVISERTKERLAEKHGINNADNKNLDEVVYEIAGKLSQEERSSLVSASYDYVVNKMFTIENIDDLDPDEYFPQAIIIRPKTHIVVGKLKSKFGTHIMRIMPKTYFEEVASNNDMRLKSRMFATENGSKEEYAIVVV
jgi:hypothetical protein